MSLYVECGQRDRQDVDRETARREAGGRYPKMLPWSTLVTDITRGLYFLSYTLII